MLTKVHSMSDSINIDQFRELITSMESNLNTREKHFDSKLNELKGTIDSNQLLMIEKLNNIYTIQVTNNEATKTMLSDHEARIRTLESFNAQNYGARRANDRAFNWFSDNWFKIVSLFIMSIPVIAYLYVSIKGN